VLFIPVKHGKQNKKEEGSATERDVGMQAKEVIRKITKERYHHLEEDGIVDKGSFF
jgi:hypothetical protein